MSYQWPEPGPPPVPECEGHQQQAPQDAEQAPKDTPAGLESREPPLVTSAGVPKLWNGHDWVPARHVSTDGKAWWNGVSWVAVPSRRHQVWGTIAIVLAALTLTYCTPMSLVGIADSRARAGYDPGLSEALFPLVLAMPAVAGAVTSIVLDLREKRRPLRGWLSIALATLAAVFLWVSIFAGT